MLKVRMPKFVKEYVRMGNGSYAKVRMPMFVSEKVRITEVS